MTNEAVNEAVATEGTAAAATDISNPDTTAGSRSEDNTASIQDTEEVPREDSKNAESPTPPQTDTPPFGRGAMLHMRRVKHAAEETARLYPEFDLRREMRDPLFLKLTVATGGDTTAAYVARHYDEIISGRVRDAEKRGAEAVAASVRSGGGRPKEGALSKGGAVVEKRDPAKLSLGDFKRIRENFRKTGKRERF